MPTRRLPGVVLAALLTVVCPLASASEFGSMLDEADRVRSADAARFGQLIDALGRRRNEANEAELQRLRYLSAYRKILYQNAVEAGIADARALFDETEDHELKFRAGSLAANSLAINRDFTEALRMLAQTLPMRAQVSDRTIVDDGTVAAAAVYNQLGQYAVGLKYADETLAGSPAPRAQCLAGYTRLEARYHLGVLRDEGAIRAAIQQCIAVKEQLVGNFGRILLARHLSDRGRPDEAIRLLDAYVVEVEGIGYAYLIAEYRALLADLYLKRGNPAAAERHAHAALIRETGVASARPVALANRILYQVAEERGDLRGALIRYRRYAEAEQAWSSEAQAREMAYQMVRHELMQQTQQIDLLNQQNSVLQLRQRVQDKTAENNRLVMALLILVVAFVGFWAVRTRRLQVSLRRMAEVDALTEVCNRRHFTHLGELALEKASRSGEEVALIMFDLDHFKSINDSHGHAVGDWVLKKVAEVCRPMFREVDAFGRIGGEEFAVLLVGLDLRNARRLADDIRSRLVAIDSAPSEHAFQVTASFGVATSALAGYDLARLMSNADRMLYRAKRRGRNRVCQYDTHADRHAGDGDDVPPPLTPGVATETSERSPPATGNGEGVREPGGKADTEYPLSPPLDRRASGPAGRDPADPPQSAPAEVPETRTRAAS
jgi:diguanylate cyclase